jgi:hypothetical protein
MFAEHLDQIVGSIFCHIDTCVRLVLAPEDVVTSIATSPQTSPKAPVGSWQRDG